MSAIQKARGAALTSIALGFAMRRRWFGLEPDFLFRRRVLRVVMGR